MCWNNSKVNAKKYEESMWVFVVLTELLISSHSSGDKSQQLSFLPQLTITEPQLWPRVQSHHAWPTGPMCKCP